MRELLNVKCIQVLVTVYRSREQDFLYVVISVRGVRIQPVTSLHHS